MHSSAKRYIWLFFSFFLIIMIISYIAHQLTTPQPAKPLPSADIDTNRSKYVTIRNTDGKIILETGVPVSVDDEYISAENQHYVILKVKGNTAIAGIKSDTSNKENVDYMPSATLLFPNNVRISTSNISVAIYHTHNDECYRLTSGLSTRIPDGDVIKVGTAMAKELNDHGIVAVHQDNNHGPHDINAYNRSRRTAVQLLKATPDAIFDIHRDSAPAATYLTQINGIETARIMIVLGRSNPAMNANLEFARRIKDEADTLYPGLMRGIYMGRGDYNQDLYARSLLFEIGTEEVSLNVADKAAGCLSDVIIAVLGRR
ncbi:MAG: hypothetical protein GXY16_03655 [Syntrophomonadaceae bacterium]|nr:hypothetical protein [Syntrophomonadaceae bacterium]